MRHWRSARLGLGNWRTALALRELDPGIYWYQRCLKRLGFRKAQQIEFLVAFSNRSNLVLENPDANEGFCLATIDCGKVAAKKRCMHRLSSDRRSSYR